MIYRITYIVVFFILNSFLLSAQNFDLLLLQEKLAKNHSEFTNGYAVPIKSEDWNYENYWNTKTDAMLTRATSGKMEISWLSDPVKVIRNGSTKLLFLVCNNPSENPNSFDLYVNEKDVVVLQNLKKQEWNVVAPSGISCEYIGYGNNPWGDGMGFMIVTLPASLAKIGEPVKFRFVGQKQESDSFFMIFKNQRLIEELVDKYNTDELFKLEPQTNSLIISALPKWNNKEVNVQINDKTFKKRFISNGDLSLLTIPTKETSIHQITISHNGIDLFKIDSLSNCSKEDILIGSTLTQIIPSSEKDGNIYVCKKYSSAKDYYRALSESYAANSEVYIMVSSHQDIAWVDSPYQCIEDRDKLIVTPALDLLEKYQDYRYDIEDALILEEYLERHPDKRDLIGRFIAEGRLGIGASYTQPYEEIQSGEALIRQFYYGKRWVEKSFPGMKHTTYWNVDVPGRIAQMPQILKKSGINYIMYSRHETGVYKWVAPDGSSVLTYTPGHYTKAAQFLRKSIDLGIEGFVNYVESFPDSRSDKSKSAVIGMLSAEDMSEAHTYHNWINAMGNKSTEYALPLPQICHSTSDMFMNALSHASDKFPMLRGERPNLWQYIHSATHAKAFEAYGKATRLAPQVEMFATINSLLSGDFNSYPKTEVDAMWKAIIYPDHGWGGNKGSITDSLFRAKYEFAERSAGKLLHDAVNDIASQIKTDDRRGVPIVVFNGLSFDRKDRVNVAIDSVFNNVEVEIVDSKGIVISSYKDGANIEFVAQVPSMGYATYYLKPIKHNKRISSVGSKYYSLMFESDELIQIVDKLSGEELFDCSKFGIGDVICMQSVGNGAGEFSTMQLPSMEHFEQASKINNKWVKMSDNNVFATYSSEAQFRDAKVVRYMKLYKDVRRIDWNVDILGFNGEKYLEYRMMFPLRSKMDVTYSTPFSTTTVGHDEIEGKPGERYQDMAKDIHPRTTSGWIAAENKNNAVTISSSAALVDYIDPTDSAVSYTVIQPIMMASRRSCHWKGEFYLQKGDHHFDFSLTSGSRQWKGNLHQSISSQNDLISVYNPRKFSDASLKPIQSFFSIDNDGVLVSTVKKAEDSNDIIVRVYDAVGQQTEINIVTPFKFSGTKLTDMLENNSKEITNTSIKVGCRSIETIMLSK